MEIYKGAIFDRLKIQGVCEISALILTGNRTHQKEQLFFFAILAKNVA
jgi:hypothetical protein